MEYLFDLTAYTAEARGLSLLEHGAYRVLMDAYIQHGGPLPDDDRIYRLVGAVTQEERDAVLRVLEAFFLPTTLGWLHERLEVELGRLAAVSNRQRNRAIKRWGGESKTQAVWNAYATAYHERYGVEPVRNAQVNGQIAHFLKRIPEEEAPHVAQFYVRHNGRFYVQAGHPVGLMLRDAEKLRTEWATGRVITESAAKQADKRQNNAQVWKGLLSECEDRAGVGDRG